MFRVQSSLQEAVPPSQAEAVFVELDDEQLSIVSGGRIPVGGWGPVNSAVIPVGGW